MILVVAYALFLVYAVLRLFRTPVRGETDYLLAGRRLTLPAFVATTVSTWYGGILGVGEYAWTYGVSNWLVFGAPYYLYALVFALALAGRARRGRALTMPDLLQERYGTRAAAVGAGAIFVMTVPAAYVLMMGVLVEMALGWPLWLGAVIGMALSVGYVVRGGLRAVVGTEIVQFVLMFLGFLVLVPVCVAKFGGWDFLRDALPPQHLTWHGGRGFQAVAIWYVIAASTLVEPAFYQRCCAARDERTARRGLLVSILFWVFFDFLTTTSGLYARAVLPSLEDPVAAFPRLAAAALPPLLQGLFLTSLLATIMSTVDSYAFIAAITGGRDVWLRLRTGGAPADDPRSMTAVRAGLLATSVLAVALALWSGSVVGLWHHLGSVGTPVLLLPITLGYTRWRPRPGRATAAMLAAGGVSLAWLALGRGAPWRGVEPIFPGLLVSAALLLPGIQRRPVP